MQNKKTAATILLLVFLFIPLATAQFNINTKDWTIADPNATLAPSPTETPSPQTNSSTTPNPSDTSTTPNPTATQIGQTPTPTETFNPSTTPFQQTYTPSPLPTTLIIAILLLGVSVPSAIYLVAKTKRGEPTYE